MRFTLSYAVGRHFYNDHADQAAAGGTTSRWCFRGRVVHQMKCLLGPRTLLSMMSKVSFRGSPASVGGQAKTTPAAQKPKISRFTLKTYCQSNLRLTGPSARIRSAMTPISGLFKINLIFTVGIRYESCFGPMFFSTDSALRIRWGLRPDHSFHYFNSISYHNSKEETIKQCFAVRVSCLAAALLFVSIATVWRAEAADLYAGERLENAAGFSAITYFVKGRCFGHS
jgi:hypothetical protein